MGLLSSVKKAFGGGSKKKEKKKQKKPQKKTYIQNTNVGKKATQVNNQRAVSTRQTGGHTVQRRPQATTRGGNVARGSKPKAPARVNRSVGQKPSVRPTGGGQSRPVQTNNRRGNALNTGSYGNVRINQSARNRSQTNGIQPRQRQVSNPVSRNPVQNVQNFGKGVRNAWNDVSGNKPKPQVQGPPKFSSSYKPPISDEWIDRGYRNVSIGPNVQRDRSQVNGVQRRKPINNPSTGNPVRDFQNSVNNIWKEAGKAAPKTFQDFSKEWKASGSGKRDYKTVTTQGRTTPSGTTIEVMPKDLKVGDRVVTTQGTVTITGKKSGAGKELKDLDNAYDQAMTRYASAYNSGNQAEMDRAENDIRSISNQMLNARYTYDSSQTDYTQQNAAYETIDKAQKAWEKANKKGDEKGMAAAHKRAEKARANLGFSGGEAGNEYLPFNEPVQQRTEPLSFGDRFRGARDYANTQAKAREDRKYVGDVNTYNQAVEQYENSGYAGHVAGRRNQGQMKSSAMNKTGPSGGTANPTGGSYNAKLDAIQKNISERDRFVYNYLYSTQGKKAADNFLDAAWNVNISQTAANRANEQLSDWAKSHPVAATVTSTMMQPFNTMAGAGQMVNNAVTGQKADPYFSAIGNSTNTSREAVKSTIGSGVGRGAYDVGTNIADMVLDTVLGGTIGGAAGSGASTTARLAARRGIIGSAFKKVANNKVANKAIDKLLSSSAITTGLMSTQSAYSTYVQSVNSGVATDVALSNAVANGALEFLSEMPAVENLFSLGKLGRMGGAPISNAKDFAKKLGAQMGIEAGGEAFANLTQTAADSVLMGSRSQVAQQAAAYEGQGMSPEEALKQARIDSYYTQTWQAAAMGAIAGGIMSGGAMGVGTVRTGQYIRSNSDFARDLATVYQSELADGKYKNVADTILNNQESEAPARVGVIKAANMKGELAKHFSDQLNDPSLKGYLYNYVGLEQPNSRAQQMKDIFAEYLGRDTGYASKEFSDAWLRISRDMEMNLALYRQTHDPQLREALEEYLDNATMLLYSGELSDAAETTSIVRAEVNAELNGINANAGGNAVVSEDIDTVVEQGQVNEEGDPVEEAVLQEETPVAQEDQQAVQQEAETIGDIVEGVADESGVDVQTQAVSSTAFNPEGEQAVAGTTAPTTASTTDTTAGTTSGTNGTISSGGATVTETPPQTGSITEGTVSQIGTTEQNAGTQTQFEPTDSYPVGQKNRGNVTYHRSAGNPTGRIEAARNIMRANGLSTDSYDVISENDNGTVTFINAKDFDTATEPVILNKVIVDLNDGSIRNETSGTEIIPEKSQLVPVGYSGFDVDAQRAREDSWRNQSGIRFNATRLNDKAYFEETFGDYLRQQEGANNDTERYEETGASRDTAEREPVSSAEGEGRTEEVRGENSEQVVSDLPEESERVPVSGRESTGNGTDSTEQGSSRDESDIVEEDEDTLEEAIEEELTEDNVSFEEKSEEESEETSTESEEVEPESNQFVSQEVEYIVDELLNNNPSEKAKALQFIIDKLYNHYKPNGDSFPGNSISIKLTKGQETRWWALFDEWAKDYPEFISYNPRVEPDSLTIKDFNGLAQAAYNEIQEDERNAEESNKESSPSENAAGPKIIRTIDKLPKGVKIKWSEVEKFKDKGYRYSTVQVAPSGNNLYVKLSGTNKGNPVKQVFYEIQNYKSVTANEIFMDLITNTSGSNPYPLGIHFEDAIRKFYKENDLSQGSVVPILRGLNSEEQEISEEINDTVSEDNITVAEQEESAEVEEPVEKREEENGEIILDGENDNGDRGSSGTVRQTEEEREPEESGEVDSGQSSERRTESDSGRESGISEESETVRTESETSGLGSDTAGTERKRDSSSDVERRSSSTRFYIDRRVDAQDPYSQTDTQRVKSNIEAIRLLKQIEEEGRKATDEEKQTLSMYTGWGGISGAFDKPDNETNAHKQRREELENLLTKKELNSAKDSTSDAYYTPYSVIDNVYEIVSQLGVRAGGRVLEPSCGIGAFVGCMPQSMREHSSVTAVELDEISGRIAQALYDDVNVEIQDFGKNDGSYNLIVGNVPFGENLKLITDKSYGKDIGKYDIQDGFIAKGLAQLDEGGIMAVLTTHSTMDGNKVKNQKARENFAENANLLGAIRFPANTFSGTDIVTDLLIFQKKGEGVNNDYAQDFSQLHTMENGDRVNQYFIDHPEMVLGDFQETKDRYGKDVMTVVPNETKIIDAALMQLPTAVVPEYRQNVAEQVNQEVAETIRKAAEKSSRRQYDGSLALVDGEARIYDARAKVYKPYVPVTKNGKPYAEKSANTIRKCAVSMIEIAQERDLLLAMEAELDNSNTSQQKIEAQKQKLASLCETHMKKFGAFNNKTNIAIRNTDATLYGKVSELYEITKVNGRTVTTKRSILEPGKRVLQKRKKITHTNSIRTAIRSSMYEYGMIDLPYISKITGKSEEEIVSEFDHTIYKDPVNGGYQSEGIYLSGNIYQKIADLEKYIEAHPDESEDLQRNLHDLESAKPERKTADMITTHLGSPWVSPDMMEDFFVDYFGVPKGVQQHGWWTGVHFAYDPAIGKWGINLPDYLLHRSNRYSGVEWEVGGKGISDYLEYILNNKQLEIKKKVIVDNEEKSVKDEVKTTEALQKAEALDSAFSEWILKDASRMDEVENEFNRRYNNYVAPKYDVKGFTYEGMNPLIELNHHQATGVARATQNQNTLFMHPVGSGKTFTMIATAMEWHRLGQSKKTALICQKNKIMDFENDIKLLYPAAKVLTITDFSQQNRGAVMARIQNEDWDFIVMGYNSFQSIPLSIEYMERYKDEQVSIYRDALERLKADGSGDRRSISSIAKSIKTYEGNLAKQIQAAKENLKPTDLFFEDLGIDSIMVDEAQNYKNLPQVTSLSRVKGVANPISQASVGNTYMHMVTTLLNERKNHIVFATATPVTNTLGELYAYLRYLMPDVLTETGMGSFDGWVKMFAEKTQTNELNTSGTGVRTVERLGTYKNLGALRKFIEPVFDIVSKKDIHKIKLPQADTLHVMAPASNALVMLNKTIEHLKSTSASSDDPGFFLKMYNLAKDAAIDFRLVRKRAISMGVIPPGTTNEDLDFPESKLNCCVRQVLEDYRLTTPEKGVQLIFLDRGMRPADPDENPDGSDISLYQDIINKLIKGGIPKSEIASMSPSDGKQLSDEAKQKIMDQANEGKIRVIIGSSATAGVGINVQTLLYAEHHLDMPDVPANYEQRKGRILRQHNRYAEEDFQNEYGRNRVKLYHYSTSNSQDAARLQMVDRKASMINAPFEDTSVEELEDQDDVSAVLMKMEVGAANSEELFALEKQKEKVLQLTAKENNFRTKQAAYTRTRNNYESEKERLENNIKKYERGKEKASKVKKKAVYKVGDQTFEKLGEASKAAYELFANSNMMKRRDGLVIGTIDGVAIRAREQRTGEGSYGTFRLTVDGIPWFGFRDISMLDKDGRALNKDPKTNQPQSIFEIVRNQLEAERADRYIEQFHEDLNRLEANYQDALKHVDETSPFVKDLQEAERKKSEMEKALGDIQAPTAEDLHMVSYEDLGKMNGTVRTEEIVLESAKDDQRMAREAAENTVIEETVEETETVKEAEVPVKEATETTQAEQLESEQSELEEAFDEVLDDNGVLYSREPAGTTETVEQTATTETTGYKSTNRTPTRGNFAPSYARENAEIKGITAEVIDSLTDREKASVTGIKSILTRAKALFPSANIRNVHYRGDKAAGALGHYESARMLINTQDANQLGVTMHELGHHIHDVYEALSDPDIVKALQSMIKNVPGLYNTLKARKYRNPVMPKEVFADFVWHYMINPDAAWQMGSYAGETNFYDMFESMLSKKDLAALKEIRKMVLAFNNQDINTRISSTIKTARQAKRENNPTIIDVLTGKRKKSEVNSKWRNRKRNIITGIVNSTNPAKEINRRIEEVTGKKVSTDLDLQYAVESMDIADSVTTQMLVENFVTPDNIIMNEDSSFFDILDGLEEKVKGKIKSGELTKEEAKNWFNDFENYLKARHGIDWESVGKYTMSRDVAGEYDVDDHESNIKAYEADIEKLDKKYGSLMEETSDALYDWWKQFNEIWMIDTGLVDEEVMRDLWERYPHYIPMYRVMDNVPGESRGNGGGNTHQTLKKSSKEGSQRETLSPIENMIRYVNNVVKEYHNNKVAETIHKLYNSQDEDVQAVMTDYIQKDEIPRTLNVVETARMKERLKKAIEENDGDSSVVDEVIGEQIKSFYPDPGKLNSGVIVYREGNTLTAYRIYDDAFYMMLNATNPNALDKAIKVVGKFTRIWSALITSSNVFFAVRNAVRDWQHAYITAEDMGPLGVQYFVRYPLAFGRALFETYRPGKNSEMWNLYTMANDFESKYISSGEGTLERTMKKAGARYAGERPPILTMLVDFVLKLNAAIEAAPRYAQFKATYEKTNGSAKEKFAAAMRTSRNVTVNFHVKGAYQGMGLARSIVPFLNASIQGIDQARKVIASKEAWTTKKGLSRIVRLLVMQSVPAVLLGLLYHDDDEYKQMENYLKEGYWLFKVGDTWVRLPRDREFSAFAATPFTQYLMYKYDDDFSSLDAIESVFSFAFKNWVPSLGTTAAGLTQAYNNRAWYGGKIVSSYDENLMVPGFYQEVYDGTTGRLAIRLAKFISEPLPDSISIPRTNINIPIGDFKGKDWDRSLDRVIGDTLQEKLGYLATPKGIEYAADQMTGIIGDILIPLNKPTEGVAGMLASIRNQFVADPYKSDRYIDQMYNISNTINAASETGTMNDLQDKWKDTFSETLKTSKRKDGEEPDFKTIGDYRAEMKAVKVDPNLSYAEKQERITELYKAMGEIAEEMVTRYRKGLGPLKDNYGDVNLTEEAKAVGFTEKKYAKVLSDIKGSDNQTQKQYYIASSNLTDEQKQYLSQHTMGKDYEDFSGEYEPLVNAGLTEKQTEKYLSKNTQGYKQYLLVKDSKLTEEQKKIVGPYISADYNEDSLDTWRKTYQPMIDAGWSASKAMSELEEIKKYNSDKANIVNALQRYSDNEDLKNAMASMAKGSVTTYNTKHDRYVAYAESGLSPDLIDKAYTRHKELKRQGASSANSYQVAAREYTSSDRDYELLYNVLYMR